MRTVLPLDARYDTRSRVIKFAAGSRVCVASAFVCVLYSCEDILVDERMSFLDDFVQMQLTAGARPYLAPAQRPDFSGELQLGTRFSPSYPGPRLSPTRLTFTTRYWAPQSRRRRTRRSSSSLTNMPTRS